jgi:hypothetical protein
MVRLAAANITNTVWHVVLRREECEACRDDETIIIQPTTTNNQQPTTNNNNKEQVGECCHFASSPSIHRHLISSVVVLPLSVVASSTMAAIDVFKTNITNMHRYMVTIFGAIFIGGMFVFLFFLLRDPQSVESRLPLLLLLLASFQSVCVTPLSLSLSTPDSLG